VPEVRALTDAIAHARDQVLRQQALDALSA